MFSNYFKILLRFMSKQKGFSVINISGLTISIACSLLILLYIQDELKYDRFHYDADRIFRVGFRGVMQGIVTENAQTGFPLAPAIKDVDGVHSTTRMASWRTFPVKYEDKTFTEKYLLLVDPNFFRFFSFNLAEGHPDSVLRKKDQVVITESAAKRYFNYQGKGDTSPVGKTLIFAQGHRVVVSGIAKDPPPNSHFHFTLLLSLSTWEAEADELDDWISGRVYTYYKLFPSTATAPTEALIKKLLDTNLDKQLETLRHTNLESFKKQGNDLGYFIQPLRSIHLNSALQDEIEINGSFARIILFGCIALFITLLACINFMNLTTAQSASRAKEIAVRKTAGAHDLLVGQFLLESYFYVIVGVVHAWVVVAIAVGPFNYFTGKQMLVSDLLKPEFLVSILIFVVITGLVAGSYPAFYLTHFNPVEVLKGNLRARIRTYGIRNVLVVFQFFISACLIIATLVVYEQLQFIQKADVGFDKANVVNLLHTLNLKGNGVAFKKALLREPSILSASYCNRMPPNVHTMSVFRPVGEEKDYLLTIYEMDEDHMKTMGYEILAGRFFREDSLQDMASSVIINETAARKMGLWDFQGKKLFTDHNTPTGTERKVIGIMQDFNFQSLKDPIQPMAILLGAQPNWEMAIRLKEGGTDSTMAFIRNLWRQYAPDAAFEYTFVEKNFDLTQGSEKRIGFLFLVFTVLAIVIACLGLFGLATFTAEQKRKQIGIRKVLGASTRNIVTLLNKDFLKLVLIANLIAWPFTWWVMRMWLNQFAYHTEISWWVFLSAGAATILIALLSISFRAYKAAVGNPVHSLKTE